MNCARKIIKRGAFAIILKINVYVSQQHNISRTGPSYVGAPGRLINLRLLQTDILYSCMVVAPLKGWRPGQLSLNTALDIS
jgi:hypothetical protein